MTRCGLKHFVWLITCFNLIHKRKWELIIPHFMRKRWIVYFVSLFLAGKSGDWYYPGYEHPGYPWQYGYPYGHHSTYPYPYHYPYQHLPLPAATLPPSHPAVHVQGPVVVSHPAQQPYPYPYHYPYHYQYPYNYPCHYGYNCGYPYGYAVPAPAETKEENRKEEKNGSKEKEDDKKSKISH